MTEAAPMPAGFAALTGYVPLVQATPCAESGMERAERSGGTVIKYAEGVTLIHGDCLKRARIIADAVISDPPYGMEWDGKVTPGPNGNKGGKTKHHGETIEGDDEPFDPSPWLQYPRVVLWGMQHYASRLPVGTVLVWVKRFEQAYGTFLSDADLAWMKGGHGVYCRQGPMPQAMAADRLHPTQKPVELMAWCLDKAGVPVGATVLDPYMGSGSTGIACLRTGRKFIGIERDPKHFATAHARIDAELSQRDLFLGGGGAERQGDTPSTAEKGHNNS